MKYFSRVLKYLKPYWRNALASVSLIFIAGLVSVASPWPLAFIIDNVIEQKPLPPMIGDVVHLFTASRFGMLLFFTVAGLTLALAGDLVGVLESYINTRLELSMALDFRSELFLHAQRLSLAFHDHRRAGMVIYAINFQADSVANVIMVVPGIATSVVTLIGMFCTTYYIDHYLALISLAVMPFLYWSVGFYVNHIQEPLNETRAMEGEVLSIIHEAMSMMRVIVAFCRETYEHARFRNQAEQALKARVKITVKQTFFGLAVSMTTAVGTALVLGVGAYHAMNGKLSTGQLLAIIGYIAAIYKPMEAISTTVGGIQEMLANLRIAFGLLDTPLDIADAPDAVDVHDIKGNIVFENVHFSYAERPGTLKNISFSARAGEVVALVGPTGAGKTTLMSLIPRFYDLTSGRILIDGMDMRKITLQSLREQVSIVLQEPLLFSGSVLENIRYGRLTATDEEIVEAAKAANAHDFIMRLPEQYQTMIGERGSQLSGGERQRLSVARAFLKKSPFLILDEPTSSIDSRTEAVILDALDRLMEGRTTFVVAHRLSTIRNAEKILVLNHGELAEMGSHEELLERNGLYKQLYDMQTKRPERTKLASAFTEIQDPTEDGIEPQRQEEEATEVEVTP